MLVSIPTALLFPQSFDTVPGQTYTVRFATAGHPSVPNKTRPFIVSVADVTKTFESTPGQPATKIDWKTETFEFIAKENRSTLKFESPKEVTGWWGAYIDNVAVMETARAGNIADSRPQSMSEDCGEVTQDDEAV